MTRDTKAKAVGEFRFTSNRDCFLLLPDYMVTALHTHLQAGSFDCIRFSGHRDQRRTKVLIDRVWFTQLDALEDDED
jgi:hypothetical protein